MIESIQELLQKEAQAVLNIPVTDAYEKAVELIVEQIHRKKGKLVTSGMGKAGQIAMNKTKICQFTLSHSRYSLFVKSIYRRLFYFFNMIFPNVRNRLSPTDPLFSG